MQTFSTTEKAENQLMTHRRIILRRTEQSREALATILRYQISSVEKHFNSARLVCPWSVVRFRRHLLCRILSANNVGSKRSASVVKSLSHSTFCSLLLTGLARERPRDVTYLPRLITPFQALAGSMGLLVGFYVIEHGSETNAVHPEHCGGLRCISRPHPSPVSTSLSSYLRSWCVISVGGTSGTCNWTIAHGCPLHL